MPTLSRALTDLLDAHATTRRVGAGETLLDVGEPVRSIPAIVEGAVKVLRGDAEGGELLLYFLGPGDTCAATLTCCEGQARSTIRAVAEVDSTLYMLPAHLQDDWMGRYPAWRRYVMANFAARFGELLGAVDDVAFERLETRLLKALRQRAALRPDRAGNLRLGRNRIEVLWNYE